MQRRILAVIVSALAFMAPASAVAAPLRAAHQRSQTYLALGDSLAAGYQPGPGEDKAGGYVGQVYATVKRHHRSTDLVNLACSGETAASMVAGGPLLVRPGQPARGGARLH